MTSISDPVLLGNFIRMSCKICVREILTVFGVKNLGGKNVNIKVEEILALPLFVC